MANWHELHVFLNWENILIFTFVSFLSLIVWALLTQSIRSLTRLVVSGVACGLFEREVQSCRLEEHRQNSIQSLVLQEFIVQRWVPQAVGLSPGDLKEPTQVLEKIKIDVVHYRSMSFTVHLVC